MSTQCFKNMCQIYWKIDLSKLLHRFKSHGFSSIMLEYCDVKYMSFLKQYLFLKVLMECKKRTAFVKLLTWIEKKSECNGQTLEHLLHYPTQVVSILAFIQTFLSCRILSLILNFETDFQNLIFMKSIFSCQKQLFAGVFQIVVLKNFSNSTGKHLCWRLFLINRCFPVKFEKCLRTTFFT